jgi:hypothetical protein
MAFPGSPFRPTAISRVMNDQLSFRGAVLHTALTSTQSLDSLGNQVITFSGGSWSSNNQFALIQILSSPAWTNVNTDVLGLTQTVWTPDIINVGLESAGATHTYAGLSVLNWETMLCLLGVVLGFGTRVQIWATANGTQPSISAGIMQGTLAATFDDLFNPTTATM